MQVQTILLLTEYTFNDNQCMGVQSDCMTLY